jgi:hypothetical protein
LGDIGKRGHDMEQEYLNCKHGLTQQCQQIDNPLMRKLHVILYDAKHIEYLTADDLIRVKLLCNECDSFVPREE